MGFVCSLVAVVIFLFTGVFSHLSAIYGKLMIKCLKLGVQNYQIIPNLLALLKESLMARSM